MLSGIDTHTFVTGFAVGAVISAVIAQVWRILALFSSTPATAAQAMPAAVRLDPVEAAYLAGGRSLATTVAVAAHRVAPTGGFADATTASAVTVLTRAINLAQRSSPEAGQLRDGTRRRGVGDIERTNPDVREGFALLEAELRHRGLLLTPRRRLVIALAGAPLALVVLLAALRLLLSPAPLSTSDYSLLAGDLAAAMICAGLLFSVPRNTRLGMSLTRTPEILNTTSDAPLWGWAPTGSDDRAISG